MLILLLRYFFVYWILLGGSASEETLLRDLNLEVKDYPIALCKLRCMHRLRKHKFSSDLEPDQVCTNHCNRDDAATSMQSEKYRYIHLNYSMILVCRDDKSLTFRILHVQSVGNSTQINSNNGNKYKNILFNRKEDEEHTAFTVSVDMRNATAPQMQSTMTNPNVDTGQLSELTDAIYMVKVQSDTNATTIYMSNENFFTITELNSFTSYTISAAAVISTYEYAIVTKEEKFSTLQHGYTPGSVADINFRRFFPDDTNEMHLMADITWQPPEDRTCHYVILYFDESGYDVISMEIRNPRQLYTYTLENLTFSAVYNVGILARNTKNVSKESEMKWLKIQTPSCAKWYNYNFTICPPFKPKNLKVERKYIRDSTYSLNITWDKPEHSISSYIIMIVDRIDTIGREYNFTVNKSNTMYFIPEIELNGTLVDVHLIACTPGGSATVITQEVNNRTLLLPENSQLNAKYVAVMIVSLSCLGIIFFYGRYRYAKYKRHQQRCKYFRDLESKAPIDPKATFDFPTKNLITSTSNFSQFQYLEDKIFLNDAMEIDRTDVTLLEILGEGAFGLVRRGLYNNAKSGVREVAVKMLKERPSIDDERAFRREIEVMKSVEPHPNIVGIIGHCTKPSDQMLLLTEYCSFGNLLDFLRDEWKYLYELNVKSSGSSIHRKFGRLSRTSGKKRHRRSPHNSTQTHHQRVDSDSNSNTNSNSVDRPFSNGIDCHYAYKSGDATSGSFARGLFGKSNNNDDNIVERLKFKYKYLNTLQQLQQQKQQTPTTTTIYPPSYDISATTTMTSITTMNDSAPPPPPTPLLSPTSYWAADNKSYGYEDICCRACKYHMNIDSAGKKYGTSLNSVDVGDDEEKQKQQINEFHLKNCVCQQQILIADQTVVTQQQQQQEQQSNAEPKSAGTVENKSYFKLFHEILSEAAWRRRQWERRHARAAIRNRRLALAGVHNESSTTTTTTTTAAASCTSNADKAVDNDALSSCVRRQPLAAADLLDIARQVAVGMEFLAKNKVVHRDLAARNVLVATDRTIKIADFGLSRDVYQENIYKKTGNGKLPIKWLALESMTHQVYTTQSDVWSYGILLYEIVTLGSTPYPSIPTSRLLNLLKSGYRMERPKNCGPEFYNLMYACWNVNPCERPTFSEIIRILADFFVDEPERPETILGMPNLECMEQCASRLLNLNNEEQLKQDIEENSQSPLDDDKMIDTSNMDDCYLKPLQSKNKSE